jgi:hypothetical protein
MQSQNHLPPAPPPIAPKHGGHDPYDFILNPGTQPKKRLLPRGNSTKQRIILVVSGAVVLLMLILIVTSLLSSAGRATKQEWLKLSQQQTELIRVSDIGVDKAEGSSAKNLAITSKLTLESAQADIIGLAKKSGAEVSQKQLEAGQNAETDSKLLAAEQTNQFDSVFVQLLKDNLKEYQDQLKKLYDLSGTKTKAIISPLYNSVGILINEEAK